MRDRTSKGWIDYDGSIHPAKPKEKKPISDTADLFAPVVPAARLTDPDTSNEGIADVLPRAGSQQRKLLLAYASRPMGLTAEEACEITGLTQGGWKRISELHRAGLLDDTGQTRLASTGSLQKVLGITRKGLEAIL